RRAHQRWCDLHRCCWWARRTRGVAVQRRHANAFAHPTSQLNSSFLILYQLSRLRVTVSGESTLALKPPPCGFTLGVLAGTDGIAGIYSTAASVFCPSSEVRKSIRSLPAFGCGAFLVSPTECMGAEIGSTFSHSTGAPFCALSTA